MAIKKQGSKQINLPEVTTAQRSTEKGRIQFNTTLGLAEYYDGTGWKVIDAPPTVSSASPATPNGSGVTVTVTGEGFNTTGTTLVNFIDEAGGKEMLDARKGLDNVFKTGIFDSIQNSWDIDSCSNGKLKVCSMKCGKEFDPFAEQFN